MTQTSFAFTRGKPIVRVTLHGTYPLKQRMLVDSGADLVTVPPDICEDLGWQRKGQRSVLIPGLRRKFTIYEGEIEFNDLRMKASVMAVDLPGMELVDGLLGREFIDQFKVCFEKGKCVTFEN